MQEGAGKRVLVIDDEPLVCDTVRLILEDEQYEVACTTLGTQGVAKFFDAKGLGRPFDVVLCDLSLGGMHGYDVYQALLAHLRGVRFVIMTGGPCGMGAARALEELRRSQVPIIEKPFSIDGLLAVISGHPAATS